MGVPGKSDLSEVERPGGEKESSRENEQWNNIRNTLLIAQFFSDVGLLSSNIYLFTSGLILRGQQVSTIASVLFRFSLYSQCVCVSVCVCVRESIAQLCLTLCNPMDYSLPGSSVHGILQARILEWVAMHCSRESAWLRDWTKSPALAGRFFTTSATWEAPFTGYTPI